MFECREEDEKGLHRLLVCVRGTVGIGSKAPGIEFEGTSSKEEVLQILRGLGERKWARWGGVRGGYKAVEDGFEGNLTMDETVPHSAGLEKDRQFPKEAPPL